MHVSPKHATPARTGAMAVEFAIAFSILLTVFFAVLEFSRGYQLKQAAHNAAYEGARASVIPGAQASNVTARAQSILDAAHVQSSTITINPTVITDDTLFVTVSANVPFAPNSWFIGQWLESLQFNADCTLRREDF